MTIIEGPDSTKVIPLKYFLVCKEDGISREEICEMYTSEEVTGTKYCPYLRKLDFHLKNKHNLSLEDYCKKYLQDEWPVCPRTGKELNIKIPTKTCVEFKNRNYRKNYIPWNKGLRAKDDVRLNKISQNMSNRIVSEETKAKQRLVRELSPIKVRHRTKHSEESKEKMRIATVKNWAKGIFNKVTSIHIKTREFLKTLQLKEKFVEEYPVKYFSLDFAFPECKIGIEVQGTFFHIDPRVYPNGPTCFIQKRNYGRDKLKREMLTDRGWIIIEIWETEINDGSFKEQLLCKLRELNLLEE